MTKDLEKGDKVAWNTSQGETHGRVQRKQTRPAHIERHKVAATPSHNMTGSGARSSSKFERELRPRGRFARQPGDALQIGFDIGLAP